MKEAKFNVGGQVGQNEHDKIMTLKQKGFTLAAIIKCGIFALEERLKQKEKKEE